MGRKKFALPSEPQQGPILMILSVLLHFLALKRTEKLYLLEKGTKRGLKASCGVRLTPLNSSIHQYKIYS